MEAQELLGITNLCIAGDFIHTDAMSKFTRRSKVPTLGEEVVLGLNTVASETLAREQLTDTEAWFIGPDEFDGLVGPFRALDVLGNESIQQVNVGPRTHCAGPPLEFGPEWSEGRHLVIEPTGIDSCLQWYAVHLLLDDDQITAVTLDLFGP